MINSIEERAIKRLEEFWSIMTSRNDDSIKRALDIIDEGINGFGTGIGEYFRNKSDLKNQMVREKEQVPSGYNVSFDDMITSCWDNIVTLSAKMIVEFQFDGKSVKLDNGRITSVFREENGELLMVQIHTSFPDVSSEEEVAPGSLKPRIYDPVSILFTDFVGFTKISSTISPQRLVDNLNELFAKFDEITDANGLLKIKTIGDAYMAVSGIKGEKDYAQKCVNASMEIMDYLKERNKTTDLKWNIRIGIHSGAVVGGIIGSKNMAFDIWGDTVNVASRIESAGLINKINISSQTYSQIKDIYKCNYRGKVELKGKGHRDTYYIEMEEGN